MRSLGVLVSIVTFSVSVSVGQSESPSIAPASAKETILHTFCSKTNCPDGGSPEGPLIADKSGNFYGTTEFGGANGSGTVFELQSTATGWKESVLYNFCSVKDCSDGLEPVAGLTMDASGNLYGTTLFGGSGVGNYCEDGAEGDDGCGVVFKLSESKGVWTETVLHAFGDGNPLDGAFPVGGVVLDAAGNLYGATSEGGDPTTCPDVGCGVVYAVSPVSGGWKETVLHYFALDGAVDGIYPSSGVILDSAGNLYGTTGQCDSSCQGIAYKLATDGWTEATIYGFPGGADGARPEGGLVFDSAGNLYGTTSLGGAHNAGTVFKLNPKGQETILHSFSGPPDGDHPLASLIIDSSDNLYGTTQAGGGSTACTGGCGTFFELKSTGGTEEVRYGFSYTNGAFPVSTLLLSRGVLYGTAPSSSKGEGVAYSIVP
jgi:uncharacterized repeat protein (TIGR03803 family)